MEQKIDELLGSFLSIANIDLSIGLLIIMGVIFIILIMILIFTKVAFNNIRPFLVTSGWISFVIFTYALVKHGSATNITIAGLIGFIGLLFTLKDPKRS